MNKKIMLIITGLGIGGAERQVSLLADKFTERGNTVQIVSLTGNVEIRPQSNINIINVAMKKNVFGFILAIVNLVKITKGFDPDIVHSHMFHANIMARLIRFFSRQKFKLVCTAHNKNEGGRMRMLAYRFTDFLCDVTTNVSQEALDEFIGQKAFSKSKSITVYNGINTHAFKFDHHIREGLRHQLSILSGEQLILAVGRLTAAKDYPNLLHALKLLPENYKLVVVGEGELRPVIEQLIHELNLQARVRLMGSLMNVSPYYSACDIFVLSSEWEGFGLVAAEAMSSECLVVSTDAGGVAEVVGDDRFIVPISNSRMLAEKVSEVMSLSLEKQVMIRSKNRSHIETTFAIDSIVDKWMEIFFGKEFSKRK